MIAEQNAVMALVPQTNVTDEAIGGNWSDPNSWKSGHLPAAGANIEIDPGITEVYDLASSPAYNTIRVDGTLTFSQASSTSLLVQTIVDMPTGTVDIVEPDPTIRATVTFADSGPLDLANDPKELGRGYLAVGLMNADGTMGATATTNIVGAKKDGWESISGVSAGSSSLSLATVPIGWRVGDTLLFNGTGIGSQDEEVSLTGTAGSTITFAPLQYDHIAPNSHNGPLTTTVANLTRNVVFQSQELRPAAPLNFKATPAGATEIDFAWDAVSGASGYEILRQDTGDGSWRLLARTTANSYAQTGLNSGMSGTFRVLALGSGNADSSPASATAKAQTAWYPSVTTNPGWPASIKTLGSGMAANYLSALRTGHIMFMHTDQDTIDYVEMDNLGRTDKSKVLNTTTVDPQNGEVVTNVVGRYALHFHRLYNSSPDCLVSVVGDVVTAGAGWGYDNHSSNIHFTDDIDYGTYGAGFVTEAGDEIGSFIHDLTVHNTSNHSLLKQNDTGEASGGRQSQQDFGSEGIGFWIQGKYGIALENNVAAESTQAGFWINGNGLKQGGGFGTTQFWTQNITDPTLIPPGNPPSVACPALPEVDFTGNSAEYVNEGLWLKQNPSPAYDEIQNFTSWGSVKDGIENYYEIGGHFDGITLLGETSGVHASIGLSATFGYSGNNEFSGMDIENFYGHGLEVSNKGNNVINNAGYFDNKVNLYLGQPDETGTITVQGTDPTFGQASHVPNGWDIFFQPLSSSNYRSDLDQVDGAKFRPYTEYWNTVAHPNSQIYMQTQAWDFKPFYAIPDGTDVPTHFAAFQLAAFSDADKAMTNGELWQTYGRTVGGYAAPADATQLMGSNVLIAESQTLPSWLLRSKRETNQPNGYIPSFYDPATKTTVMEPAVNLHEGWNFIPETYNGQLYSLMVFVDTQPPVLALQAKQVLLVTLAQLSQPFAVYWTYQDDSKTPTPTNTQTNFKNLLIFPVQTMSAGTPFIVIPVKKSDRAGNLTELDVTIAVTPGLDSTTLRVIF
jgi:hypothetical protein